VLGSKYAYVGPVPVALLGVVYYAVTLAVWAWALAVRAGKGRQAAVGAAVGWAVVGLVVSLGLMGLQVAVVRAICPLCTASAGICLVLFVLTLGLARRRDWDRQPVAAVVVPVLVLGLGFLAWMATGRTTERATEEVIGRVGDQPITRREMEEDVGGRLRSLAWQRYRTEKEWVDQKLADAVIQREAKARGVTPAQLVETEVNAPVQKQVEAFLTGKTAGVSKEELALARQRARVQFKAQRAEAFVEGLKQKYGARSDLRPPEIREEDLAVNLGWRRGPEEAPARIVIFSDFACPYCAEMAGTIDKVVGAFPGKVSVVYRYLPMEEHYRSEDAAVAAECAGRQGKFWEFHDALMKEEGQLGGVNFLELGKKVGLDEKEYRRCLDGEAAREQVKKSDAQARGIGIETTPGVFLNGKRIGGAVSYEELSRRVGELVK
jgi:predicted DsbA family dithiol-disulfide isomerase/uncharacterized membrane protein